MKRTHPHELPGPRIVVHSSIVAVVLVTSLIIALYSRAVAQGRGGAEEQGSTSAQSRTVTYDAAGRLVREDYGDGKIVTYTYDASGNLLHMGPVLAGDMDADCDVDIVDIMRVARRWGTAQGDANYDPFYDLDADGDIDIVDIMLVATQWGEHCG